jgi:hypothetical protein
MAAPTPTARPDPTGIYLDDGWRTLITFAANAAVSFWERTVQPPGVDGGDAIDSSTMHNDVWRRRSARSLKEMSDSVVVAAYDPEVYVDIIDLVNRETTITVTFPDGSTLAFYGYLRVFEPGELADGEVPEATITITPTNWDPAARAEAAPVLTSVAGT